MRVFVDTSALLPFLHRDDNRHGLVLNAWREARAERAQLTTSNYVIVESAALLQRRLGVGAVSDFMQNVIPLLHVVWVVEEVHRTAVDSLLRAQRRDLSLVDSVSFVLMQRLAIETALSLDQHFREQGVRCLPDHRVGG